MIFESNFLKYSIVLKMFVFSGTKKQVDQNDLYNFFSSFKKIKQWVHTVALHLILGDRVS